MLLSSLENGATPELADLGKRIAACIRKHYPDERDWLIGCIKRAVNQHGFAKVHFAFQQAGESAWALAEWRPE